MVVQTIRYFFEFLILGKIDKKRLESKYLQIKEENKVFEEDPVFWEFVFEFLVRGDFMNICNLLNDTEFHKKNHLVKKFTDILEETNFFYKKDELNKLLF